MPYLAQDGHSTWASREAVIGMTMLPLIYFFDLLLQVIFTVDKRVCVKDSSAKGTCYHGKRALSPPGLCRMQINK